MAILSSSPCRFSIVVGFAGQPVHKEGQTVCCGEILGLMGYSGNVRPAGPEGTHLHFETRRLDQVPFDPAPFFSEDMPTTEKPISADVKRVRVIAPLVRLRAQPGMSGTFIRFATGGEEFDLTGETATESGLPWREVWLKGWIAERDVDGKLIEPVEGNKQCLMTDKNCFARKLLKVHLLNGLTLQLTRAMSGKGYYRYSGMQFCEETLIAARIENCGKQAAANSAIIGMKLLQSSSGWISETKQQDYSAR
jgi:hypothetical protein